VFSNRKYNILQTELARTGLQEASPEVMRMFDLSNPDLDWTKLANGMGVDASRTETAEEFNQRFGAAMTQTGPCLIEAVV
jgi:acetolactate synthase-1/2/3 large subunit